MTKLTDILDSGLFTDNEGQPDYRTGKVRKEVRELFIELIAELNDNDWRRPINSDELRQKVDVL